MLEDVALYLLHTIRVLTDELSKGKVTDGIEFHWNWKSMHYYDCQSEYFSKSSVCFIIGKIVSDDYNEKKRSVTLRECSRARAALVEEAIASSERGELVGDQMRTRWAELQRLN